MAVIFVLVHATCFFLSEFPDLAVYGCPIGLFVLGKNPLEIIVLIYNCFSVRCIVEFRKVSHSQLRDNSRADRI